MVRGLDIFREHFLDFTGNYVVIGGTACDIIIRKAAFTPRATKDIDIVLVVEALSAQFVSAFWDFIKKGKYGQQQISASDRKHYRFIEPENTSFPFQIELFSRKPDFIDLPEGAVLSPIPVNEELSSLSAILLDEDYYQFLIENSVI